tara:strand:- start:46 stop:630 length:585 start_codon:yes stop_codon:yes gene_type:complete
MESIRNHTVQRRKEENFQKYMRGKGLDIGSKGYTGEFDELGSTPFENAIGVDLDYPGYDGVSLPFDEESQDFVYSSHMLEHVPNQNVKAVLREQLRVVKTGGHIIIAVPHKFLYERKKSRPSRWNADHKRFYTPSSLMAEIELSLKPNTYRLRKLIDCDTGYDYKLPHETHPTGEYQMECVLEKIAPPSWELAG